MLRFQAASSSRTTRTPRGRGGLPILAGRSLIYLILPKLSGVLVFLFAIVGAHGGLGLNSGLYGYLISRGLFLAGVGHHGGVEGGPFSPTPFKTNPAGVADGTPEHDQHRDGHKLRRAPYSGSGLDG